MKVVVLAPVHRYDDIRVFRKEAVSLAERGYEVVLYARTPDGAPRMDSGVSVKPVQYASRPGRFAMLPRLAGRAWRERAAVYHVHNPDTLLIGFALRLGGRRVIYDTHEDFRTEILLRRWLPRVIRRPAAFAVATAERAAGRWLAAVIVTQEQLLRRIPQAVLIGNPPLFDEVAARARLAAKRTWLAGQTDADPLVLGYVGGVSEDRGLFRMMDLVAELNAIRPTRLLLIGYPVNDDALQRAQEMSQWALVDYRGELDQDDAFAELAQVHAGLILFQPVASHATVDPNKIYEYLTLATPFVASAFAQWRARLADADAGVFVDPQQPDDVRRVLERVSDQSWLLAAGQRGLEFIARHYSWQANGAPVLFDLYDRVTDRR